MDLRKWVWLLYIVTIIIIQMFVLRLWSNGPAYSFDKTHCQLVNCKQKLEDVL